MAPEQGPDSKNVSSGKTMNSTTNDIGSGREHSNETLNQNSLQTDSLSWIYLLRKDRLLEVCREQGIPISEGATVNLLRRQLCELIRAKRQRASSENLLRTLEEEVMSEEKSPVLAGCTLNVPPRANRTPDTEAMNIIRRWDLTYEGGENLRDFLERLEELAECYGVNHDQILLSLLEMLKDKALQWYRLKREHIRTWEEFKNEAIRFFLPKRYKAQLEEAIYHRKQGPREKAKDYIMSLQTLIRQHTDLRKLDHTDRIYDGLRCEYRLYVRRSDFRSIDELMELTDEFEHLKREEAKQGRAQPSHCLSTPQLKCWKCKRMGHTRKQCSNSCQPSCTKSDVPSQTKSKSRSQYAAYPPDDRYYISINILGLTVRALVDTGSTLTYIGEAVRKRLEKHRVRPRKHQRNIQLADQSCVNTVRVYPLCIEFNGRKTNLLVSALDSLAEPVILGMDFLHQRQAKVFIDGIELQTRARRGNASRGTLHTITGRGFLTPTEENRLQTILGKATRPLAPGKVRKYLEQTRMPRHVPAFLPPFEARPKVISVECNPVAQSGNIVVDGVARKIWEEMSSQQPLCTMRSGPPPLAPLSKTTSGTLTLPTSRTAAPPLVPLSETTPESQAAPTLSSLDMPDLGQPEPSTSPDKERTNSNLEELDILDDILSLDTPNTNDNGSEEPADLFHGIEVKECGPGRNRAWTIYPKGRPKVQVRVRGGTVRMKCQGMVRTFQVGENPG